MGLRKQDFELIIPSNYHYDDEERNDFIQSFDTGTVSETQIDKALKKRWIRKKDYKN